MESLILKWLEGNATPDEDAELRRWRSQAPENEEKFRDFSKIWRALPTVRESSEVAPAPTARSLIDRAGVRALPRDPSRARGRRARELAMGAVAAAALIVAAVAVRYAARHGSGFGTDEFVTGPSGVSTVTLRDGSVVRLGPRTRLRVTGRDADREVRLDGRAFFAIAHLPEHPFRIITSAGTVTALGTRFDLQAQGENLSVALLEGHVVVSTPGKELSLRAGQAARVVDGTVMPIARIPDADRLLHWAGNFLAFQQTPLSDVAVELERHYDVHIAVTDSALANRTVTAWFADRTLDEVLRIVCAATLAECSTGPGGVIMRPAK